MVRRFRRGTRRRRGTGVRRARRVLKRTRFRRIRKQKRKQRRKQYLWGYENAQHLEALAGNIAIGIPESVSSGAEPALSKQGIFRSGDADEILQQVKNIDDLVYAGMVSQGLKAGRANLTVRAKAQYTCTISNGNQAGSVWMEVYICKPRKAIPRTGVGAGPNFIAADVLNNNRNSAFVTDYNDAAGITLGASPFPIQNATSQTKPTILASDKLLTPYMIPPFTKNFKVIKQLKYVLPPGGQCMFRVKASGTFSRQTYGQGNTAGVTGQSISLPSFGRDIFIRFHGQVVHDNTDHSLVNYGFAALDCHVIKRYWFSHSLRPVPNYVLGPQINIGTITGANLPSLPTEPVDENE